MAVAVEASETGRSSSRGRVRSRRRSSRTNTLTTLLGAGLALSLFVLITVAVTLGGRISALSKTNAALSAELFKHEQELKDLRPKVVGLEQELTMMLEGRFPHLQVLTPDKVIPIQDQYVKNIVFTVVNREGHPFYEYKLVMENSHRAAVFPNLRLLAFDKLGVQVGVDTVAADHELGIGESRSHSSVLDVFMNSEPRYFAIHFEPGIPDRAGVSR